NVLRIHVSSGCTGIKRIKRSWCMHSRIYRIYKSLDEALGESLNAIINSHFKENNIDGFGKFMLFLHGILE
ncbi:Hypothetical predicted protein, partial [Marmota monax]